MRRAISPKGWRRLVVLGVVIVLLPVLVGSLWGYLFAHPLRQEREPGDTPAKYGITYEEVTIRTSDGLVLAAWYTPPENGAVILVGHGIADSRWSAVHAMFARHGYGVVCWDFRAHGASEGDVSSGGFNEVRDVEAALDYALAQDGVEWVGVWGGSMGGTAGIAAAARRPEIRALAADSAPDTARGILEHYVRLSILQPFFEFVAEHEAGVSVDDIRPIDDIQSLGARPVFIIHGDADSRVPVWAAQNLYDAAGEPHLLWIEPGMNHLEIYRTQMERYERRVIAFFDTARQAEGVPPAEVQERLELADATAEANR